MSSASLVVKATVLRGQLSVVERNASLVISTPAKSPAYVSNHAYTQQHSSHACNTVRSLIDYKLELKSSHQDYFLNLETPQSGYSSYFSNIEFTHTEQAL